MHQEIYQENMHIHMGYFSFNKCSKLSRISDELQEANRNADDPVEAVQEKLRDQVKESEFKSVRGMFQYSEEARDEMDLACSAEGPLRRLKTPYIVESAEQLASDAKKLFNQFHTTERLLSYLERLKIDVAASQSANTLASVAEDVWALIAASLR